MAGGHMRLFKRKAKAELVMDGEPVVSRPVQPPYREAVPPQVDRTLGEMTGGMGQIRVGAFAREFVRNLRWAVPLFLAGVVGTWWLTKDFQRTYTGEGRVLAQISSEYVYDPVPGQTNPALMITPDHIVLNEVGIMTSPVVTRGVLERLIDTDGYGLARIEPGLSGKIRPGQSPADNADIFRSFEKRIVVNPLAKSSVINVSFKHPEPEIAVAGLNAFLDAYMEERKQLFVSETADNVMRRREATEGQLAENEASIAAFLRRNTISDFNSEREGVNERTEGLKAQLNDLRAMIAESETALGEVERQLRATPDTIDLFVDDRASQRVAQAELELKQLLAKYLPTSDPVRQKRTEIAELKSLQAGNGGRAAGGRRVGPNPVFQELTTERNNLARQADSLREKEIVLQQQLNSADTKTRKLRDLSPVYENLLRERDTLQARLRSLNTREQEALISQAQAQADSENVRVISRATAARKGRNMRAIMWLAATVVWGGIVFLLTLLWTLFGDIYARPAPATARTRSGGRRADDGYGIPEAVPAYTPATPAPPPFPHEQPRKAPAAEAATVAIPATSGSLALSEEVEVVQNTGPQLFAESHNHLYAASQVASAPADTGNPYMTGDIRGLFTQPMADT